MSYYFLYYSCSHILKSLKILVMWVGTISVNSNQMLYKCSFTDDILKRMTISFCICVNKISGTVHFHAERIFYDIILLQY